MKRRPDITPMLRDMLRFTFWSVTIGSIMGALAFGFDPLITIVILGSIGFLIWSYTI